MNVKVLIILLVLSSLCLGQNDVDPLYPYFTDVAGPDGQVNVNELQKALTASGLGGSYRVFSRAACAVLIKSLDSDYSGEMGFYEFKEMWDSINQWKDSFIRFNGDRSDGIDARELEAALSAYGYNLSPQAQSIILDRFSVNGRMAFDDFIFCMIKLRGLTDHFRRRDSGQNAQATFHYDDFIQVTMFY